MKKIFKSLFILIIALVILDFSIGRLLETVLEYAPDGRYYKANYSLNKCTEEVIIFGSSRAESNYAPFIFEDSLNIKCWNTGRGGQTLPFWFAMEEGIVSRYTPKIAIINVEKDFLASNLKEGYEHSGFLRPFYYGNQEIRPVINKISNFEKFYMYSRIYAFNSSFYYLFRPFLVKGLDGNLKDNGWKTKDQNMSTKISQLKKYNSSLKLNPKAIQLFETLVSNLTSGGCKVYIAISPNFGIIVESTPTIDYLKKMSKITLLNVSNNPAFSINNQYFKDIHHLNTKGAIAYSKEICHMILADDNYQKKLSVPLVGY